MIKLKELDKREYNGNHCIGFEYSVKNEKGEILLKANFTNNWYNKEIGKEWTMLIVIPRTRDADSQVYNFGYIMPKQGLPLELIAATGLKYFQLYLKEEVQKKVEYDFSLGSILEDM